MVDPDMMLHILSGYRFLLLLPEFDYMGTRTLILAVI